MEKEIVYDEIEMEKLYNLDEKTGFLEQHQKISSKNAMIIWVGILFLVGIISYSFMYLYSQSFGLSTFFSTFSLIFYVLIGFAIKLISQAVLRKEEIEKNWFLFVFGLRWKVW
jgi:hypothetical protein